MRTPWSAVALAAAIIAIGTSARADLIFLKDGYVLQGKVRREGITEQDAVSKDFFFVPKGFYMVDDGPRRVYFSPRQVSITERLDKPTDETISVGKQIIMLGPQLPPAIEEVNKFTEWNPKTWQRDYWFRVDEKRPNVGVTQMIATINPYYARVDAITRFKWHSAYLTSEWEPDMTFGLLKANKYFTDTERSVEVPKQKGQKGPRVFQKVKLTPGELAERRMRLINFCTQAGWFAKAEAELDALVKEMPEQKGRADSARTLINRQRARDVWEKVKLWNQAGRVKDAAAAIEKFPLKDAPDKVVADLRELRTRLETQAKLLKEVDTSLAETAREASSPDGKSLAIAVGVIRGEAHPANIERLDAFIGQYREASRQKGRGKKPPYSPDELLSLAVSGFLLGSPSAVARPEVAVGLWQTRKMVLEVMSTKGQAGRKKLIDAYLTEQKHRPDMDEVAQMIDHLPPFDAAADTSTKVQTVTTAGRQKYLLKLPPEYTHNRPYPVVIALHNGNESAKTMLQRWEKAAADHGYILAVPEWGGGYYRYTEAEQDAALDTIRDLRRRYHADSDRVYLFGLGEGGKMAFDVGLSHPDLFAGVLPMGAGPLYFPRKYWRNAQYLPFYVTMGTRVPEASQVALREQFSNWVNRGFNALWVEYKGRGCEWLAGELPNMFDWMRFQKRVFPMSRLGTDGLGGGFGEEFTTHRVDDNRFYWLSTESIHPICVMAQGKWSNLKQPAMMTARVNQDSNTIIVKGTGLKQLTVWIGRNSAGRYMIDLDRPVTIQTGINNRGQRKIKPSLHILLEDLFQRADRRHLFIDKFELNGNLG